MTYWPIKIHRTLQKKKIWKSFWFFIVIFLFFLKHQRWLDKVCQYHSVCKYDSQKSLSNIIKRSQYKIGFWFWTIFRMPFISQFAHFSPMFHFYTTFRGVKKWNIRLKWVHIAIASVLLMIIMVRIGIT